jgi:hypothetical protein
MDTINTISQNFMGVIIDTENGPTNPKIKKALDKSYKLLDIMEFIRVTKFELNMVMFNYFWQVMLGNTPSHLTSHVLEWFGYEGDYYIQRQNFKKMLKNNNIKYQELTRKDREIELYPTIQEEIDQLPTNVTNSKFLIMEPKDMKMAIMQLKTKTGHIIRQYYIDLEDLLKMYVEYTLYFNHRESQRKITSLEQMMADLKLSNRRLEESNQKQEQYMRSLGITLEEVKDQNEDLKSDVKNVQRKLNIAVEDRAPLPETKSKQERFVLIKRNDPDYYMYYTIRAQSSYTERKLKTEYLHFPKLKVLLDFKCNPNSKTLFVRIKEKLKAKNVNFSGNSIDLDDSDLTEDELIEEMKVINESKREV